MEFLTFDNGWKSHCVEPSLVSPVIKDLYARSHGKLKARQTITQWHWDAGGTAFKDWPLMSFTLNNFTFTCYADHLALFIDSLERSQTRTIDGTHWVKSHGAWQCLACTTAYRDALLAVLRPQLEEAERLADEFVSHLPKFQYQPPPSLKAKPL